MKKIIFSLMVVFGLVGLNIQPAHANANFLSASAKPAIVIFPIAGPTPNTPTNPPLCINANLGVGTHDYWGYVSPDIAAWTTQENCYTAQGTVWADVRMTVYVYFFNVGANEKQLFCTVNVGHTANTAFEITNQSCPLRFPGTIVSFYIYVSANYQGHFFTYIAETWPIALYV